MDIQKEITLQEYWEAVKYNAENAIPNVLSNQGNSHALIIFVNIFATARQKVRILAKNLDNVVTHSEEYKSGIIDFLKRSDTMLELFLTDCDLGNIDNNPLFIALRPYSSKIKLYDTKHKGYTFYNDKVVHICTADNRMYRLEYDIQARMARCNFNDPIFTEKLDSLLDNLKTTSKNPIPF